MKISPLCRSHRSLLAIALGFAMTLPLFAQTPGEQQFRDPKTEVILWPTKYRTGNIIYPYDPKK